jgi:branched-subunit amino acid aminotransferase/4-amino-4-deoxychorismate lyase
MTEPLVYLNGRLIPASQATLKIYDAGIVMGATVTEMTRTFRHRPFRLEDHLARLYRSLKYTRLNIGLTVGELERVSRELIAANAQGIGPHEELGLIHFVTAGEHPVYAGSAAASTPATPTVCAHTFPLPFQLWAEKMLVGAKLVTPSIRHVPPQCFDPKMKYRSRMHYYLADQEAQLVDPAAIALLLDLDGNVTETSGANFLMVQDGQLVSPGRRNILPGISRQNVIELARKLGIGFTERELQVHDVMNAEEALLTSTPFCLMPVASLNGVAIGGGVPGPIFKQLASAWSEQLGIDILAPFVPSPPCTHGGEG